jgi:hypothetical protein
MGWRGIMLHNGIIWLDYNGKLLTTNYSSKKEKDIEQEPIESKRNLLHSDLKGFKSQFIRLKRINSLSELIS